MRATRVTGVKSASGSKGSLPRCGLTEKTLSGARSQVWPSGGLFATRSEPMFWLPPGRFSTTTGWLQTPWSPCDRIRASVSGEPPGVNGTTMRTGRSGKLCAAAIESCASRKNNVSHRAATVPPSSCAVELPAYLARGLVQEWFRVFIVLSIRLPETSMSSKLNLPLIGALCLAFPAWAQNTEDKGKQLVDATCNTCHPLAARVG